MIFIAENVCFMSIEARADAAVFCVLLLQGFRILPCQTTFFFLLVGFNCHQWQALQSSLVTE